MSSFLSNEKYASVDTVYKYLTDKANSMQTRMQSLGSNFFGPQTVTTVYCIFVMFLKLTLSALKMEIRNTKLKILFCGGDGDTVTVKQIVK